MSASLQPAPVCFRCKEAPGVVCDGTTHYCVSCAGASLRQNRELLNAVDDAVREGLPAWPRIPDRVEFARACITMHVDRATKHLREDLESERGRRVSAQEAIQLTWAPAVKRLRRGLESFGEHRAHCKVGVQRGMHAPQDCTCGLNDILNDLKELGE